MRRLANSKKLAVLFVSASASVGVFVHSAGVGALLGWIIVSFAISFVLLSNIENIVRLWQWAAVRRAVLISALIGMAVLCVLYVYANKGVIPGANERDEGLFGGFEYLFSGIYPYRFQSSPGVPISQLPVWLVFNIPFYLLSKLSPHHALFALQNVAVIAVVVLLLQRVYHLTVGNILFCGILLVPALPNIIFEMVAGSDYLANCIAVAGMVALAVAPKSEVPNKPAFLVMLGAVVFSRFDMLLTLGPLVAYFFSREGFGTMAGKLAWVVIPSAAFTVAVWAINPGYFMPFHTSNYLGHLVTNGTFSAHVQQSLPFYAGLFVVGTTGLASMYAVWRRPSPAAVMYASATLLGVPVFYAIAVNSLIRNAVFIGPFASHMLGSAVCLATAVVLSESVRPVEAAVSVKVGVRVAG